jgi:hypothetical protein
MGATYADMHKGLAEFLNFRSLVSKCMVMDCAVCILLPTLLDNEAGLNSLFGFGEVRTKNNMAACIIFQKL